MQEFRRNPKTERKNGKRNRTSGDGRLLLVLVGVAVILVLLILIALRKNKVRAAEAESISIEQSVEESRSEAASIEASIAESEAEAMRHRLLLCDEDSVNETVKNYFALRLAGDAEGLYRLCGMDPEKGVDPEVAATLSAQASWVRSFDDIEVYLLPTEDENTRLGVAKYKINFRRVNTKAPGIMYFYLTRAEDGSWQINENLLKETREQIREEFEKSGVQSLIDENTAELKKALEADSDLALMYTSFRNGEIYSDYNLDPDREQQVDLFTNPEDSILLGE